MQRERKFPKAITNLAALFLELFEHPSYNCFPEKWNTEPNDFLFSVRLHEVHRAILDSSVVHDLVRMRVPVPMRVKLAFKFLEVHNLTDTDLKTFILGP